MSKLSPQTAKKLKEIAPKFIYRSRDDVAENTVSASTGTWESRRYLLRSDGFGFSFHYTILKAGTSTHIHYKNHVEAVLVLSGTGRIEVCSESDPADSVFLPLLPGQFYGLGGQESHYLHIDKDQDVHVACAFSPPIAGSEDHDHAGVYPAVDDQGQKHYSYTARQTESLFKPPASLAKGSKDAQK